MTTRYYAETPCPECGRTKPHSWPVWPSGRPAGPPDEMVTVDCPGGQRRELTGVEVVEWCEKHRLPKAGRIEEVCAIGYMPLFDPDEDLPCRIVSRLLVDPPKEEAENEY